MYSALSILVIFNSIIRQVNFKSCYFTNLWSQVKCNTTDLNISLMTINALLFLLLVFTYTISCSSSRKTSTALDLGNLTEVVHFINSTTPCEQISYIEANKEQIVT